MFGKVAMPISRFIRVRTEVLGSPGSNDPYSGVKKIGGKFSRYENCNWTRVQASPSPEFENQAYN